MMLLGLEGMKEEGDDSARGGIELSIGEGWRAGELSGEIALTGSPNAEKPAQLSLAVPASESCIRRLLRRHLPSFLP